MFVRRNARNASIGSLEFCGGLCLYTHLLQSCCTVLTTNLFSCVFRKTCMAWHGKVCTVQIVLYRTVLYKYCSRKPAMQRNSNEIDRKRCHAIARIEATTTNNRAIHTVFLSILYYTGLHHFSELETDNLLARSSTDLTRRTLHYAALHCFQLNGIDTFVDRQ